MRSAHVDGAGKGTDDAKGTSTKVADRFCIPLSDNCHRLQHQVGWPWFTTNILNKRDPEELANAYFQAWPGRAEWERDHG